MGYSEEFLQMLRRRSAQVNAACLLPYLKPGLRVLDFGCGPGTISVGLAEAVEPGLATRGQFDGWRAALAAWKEEPGAIAALGWGEALGRKP